ncbi:MAG: TetR family transcriptional regulator C-terminal domain-containing protein [Gaiellaceae bacterium]
MATPEKAERHRRSDGERSRTAILRAAADLATTHGLEGISIGQLADHVGMSKSGLYAHFGSKEELQLATIETAQEIFDREVIAPAVAVGGGLARVRELCERFLSHVERNVFPGGCFFASAAAELDTRPGPVQDRVAGTLAGWTELLLSGLREAQANGEVERSVGLDQLVFELNALLLQANNMWVLQNDTRVLGWARRAIQRLLDEARPAPD